MLSTMHVLFLPSWYPADRDDPFGSFFREQALAMKDAGCTVGIVAPRLLSLTRPMAALRGAGKTQFEIDEGLPTYRRASVNWTPRLWRANARRIAAAGWNLYRNYCEEHGRPDIVHVHSTIMGGAAAKTIWERDGVPFVVSEHSSAYARGQIRPAGKEIVRAVAERSSGTFAVSTPFCRLLEDVLDLRPSSYRRVPNMVHRAFLTENLASLRRRKKQLLHVSMLDQNKNVQLILNAFRDAFRGNTDVGLTIGGDGPERPRLLELARDLDIDSQVRFPGRLTREQVRVEMARADAFLLSSRYETFSMVLIEAVAMGLPLVATRCGGPEDIVTDERGILVPNDDVLAYAEAMRNIVEAGDRYNAQELRASCAAEYGPEAISAQWLDIYRRATARAGHVA
ncbi:glycosyltransferase involved in cell wall biosynthesis [Amorphus sp. MBR-141]